MKHTELQIMVPEHKHFRQVNPDEWAAFVANHKTYQTESIFGPVSIMYSRISDPEKRGKCIAEVHYVFGIAKAYFIKG